LLPLIRAGTLEARVEKLAALFQLEQHRAMGVYPFSPSSVLMVKSRRSSTIHQEMLI